MCYWKRAGLQKRYTIAKEAYSELQVTCHCPCTKGNYNELWLFKQKFVPKTVLATPCNSYHGAQLALPESCWSVSVMVPCWVLTLPCGVALPANAKSITPINSAIRAYTNLASAKWPEGVCSNPGILVDDHLRASCHQARIWEERVKHVLSVSVKSSRRRCLGRSNAPQLRCS